MNEELEQIPRKLRRKKKKLSEKTAQSFNYVPIEQLKSREGLTPTSLEAMKKAFEEEETAYKEYSELCREYYLAMKGQL